ncbi:MAG: site-2 protease family protein [Rhodospirillales bacterium]
MMDFFGSGGVSALVFNASAWIIPVLLAVTLHEAAHAWAADKLGDNTARMMGRVTFNPFRHIDKFGTVILPVMLFILSGGRAMFGWAKPVPVRFDRLRRPRRDMVLVAAAGPGVNLLLAVVAAACLRAAFWLPDPLVEWTLRMLINMVFLNVILAVFNMLPLPPLDGGRVAVGLLPDRPARALARLEPYGMAIVLGAFFVLPLIGHQLGRPINIFEAVIGGPARAVMSVIFTLAGWPGTV